MIIPFYSQHPFDKTLWYCSYHEEHKGEKYARYLSKSGWKTYCEDEAYFPFEKLSELEHLFQKFNQSPLPVSYIEEMHREDEKQWYKDFLKDEWEICWQKNLHNE